MIAKLRSYISDQVNIAVGICFMLLSVLFAFWITRIPEVKSMLGLSEGDLGTALFFTPLGAIFSMLLSANLIRWIGEGKSTVYSLMFYAFFMTGPVLAFDFLTLCIALFGVGFTMGWVDISINSVANTVEKQRNVKIMTTSHGFFSLGGIVGGVTGGILAGLRLDPVYQMAGAFIITGLIVLLVVSPRLKGIRDISNKADKVLFSFPGKSLIGLAIIAFCIMLGEGAIADWSTVYMTSSLSTGPALAGFGFAAFSAMMTLGRFNGDILVEKYGQNKVVTIGLVIAIGGLLLLFFNSVVFALIGFGLIGLGYSSIIPILFSKASQKEGVAPTKGLASVATFGYFGFLTGPVIIGWLAELTGITLSFGLLLLLTVCASIIVKREFNHKSSKL